MQEELQDYAHDHWGRVIRISQLVIAVCVFITEVVNNTILYVTRSQGYGPDTIVDKLIRYLLMTTVINFGLILVGQIIARTTKNFEVRKTILMVTTILICTDVVYSHYQFAVTLVIYVIPIMLSILYEDKALCARTFKISLVGQVGAIISRALDREYNKDIGPEAAIAIMFTISVYLFAKMILSTLLTRRAELSEAMVREEKSNASQERMRISFKMLETLARAIDAKDKYTNGHSARVAVYSTMLAKKLGWEEEEVEMLKYEALLHDIGKIGVPDSILNKPDRLSDTEFSIIQSHTLVGADILKDMAVVPNAKYVAKFHHERYDGMGYPSGKSGEDIPLNARIVCIADAYDAMSSDRIYRKALPRDVIREELQKGRGTQFDPELLDLFLELFEENKLYVRVDTTRLGKENNDHEYVMEDIERMLQNMTNAEEHQNSMKYFDKFYEYMHYIGLRYDRSIEVLSIQLKPNAGKISSENELERIARDLEVAIKKNIRSVDVHFKYSSYGHIIILLDAGIDNIDVIAQRIFFDFNGNISDPRYEIDYKLNENVTILPEELRGQM